MFKLCGPDKSKFSLSINVMQFSQLSRYVDVYNKATHGYIHLMKYKCK